MAGIASEAIAVDLDVLSKTCRLSNAGASVSFLTDDTSCAVDRWPEELKGVSETDDVPKIDSTCPG